MGPPPPPFPKKGEPQKILMPPPPFLIWEKINKILKSYRQGSYVVVLKMPSKLYHKMWAFARKNKIIFVLIKAKWNICNI